MPQLRATAVGEKRVEEQIAESKRTSKGRTWFKSGKRKLAPRPQYAS